jgi:hypothetical protein
MQEEAVPLLVHRSGLRWVRYEPPLCVTRTASQEMSEFVLIPRGLLQREESHCPQSRHESCSRDASGTTRHRASFGTMETGSRYAPVYAVVRVFLALPVALPIHVRTDPVRKQSQCPASKLTCALGMQEQVARIVFPYAPHKDGVDPHESLETLMLEK